MKKKLLSAFLAIAMIIGMLPSTTLTALATTDTSTEAKWGVDADNLTNSGTLTEAIAAAKAGTANTITIINDIETDTCYEIDDVANLTIDLNGHTLKNTAVSCPFFLVRSSAVTFKDSTGTGSITSEKDYAIQVGSNADVTIESGSYNGNLFGVDLYPAYNTASLTIKGGSFYGSSAPIKVMCASAESKLTISGSPTLNKGALGHICYEYSAAQTDLSACENVAGLVLYNVSESDSPATPVLPTGYGLMDTTNTQYTSETLSKGHYTVTAFVTLTFSAGEGTGTMEPVSILPNWAYTLPECTFTAPAGKAFAGWQIGEDSTVYSVGTSYIATADTTITAVWATPIEINFNANGGEGAMDPVHVVPGTYYTLPECKFTYEGYRFVAWQVGDKIYEAGTTIYVDEAITVTALWSEIYTITFDLNGGTSTLEPITGIAGETVRLPFGDDVTPPSGKLLGSWDTADGASFIPGDFYTIRANVTLVAQWVNACIVTVSPGDGTGTAATMNVAEGLSISLNTAEDFGFTAPEGKFFVAWNVNGTEYAPGSVIEITADTTITAVWHDPYEITFAADGGTGEMTTVSLSSTSYTLPECEFTAPEGKVFKAWRVSDGENEWEYRTGRTITVNSDLTCTAIWKSVCTIAFDANGGSGEMNSVAMSLGTSYALPECTFTAPAGKVFLAWSVDGTYYAVGDRITVTSDTTLTAVWGDDPSSFNVVLGGVGMADGDYLPSGSLYVTDAKPEAGYAYYKDGTLTLNNFSYTGSGYYVIVQQQEISFALYSKGDLSLVLEGTNTLENSSSILNTIAVGVEGDLTISGSGSLDVIAGFGLSTIQLTNTDSDFSGNLTIESGNVNYTTNTYFATGLSSSGDTVIAGGSYSFICDSSIMSAQGIYSDCDLHISGGVVDLKVQTEYGYAILTGGAHSVCIGTPITLAESFVHSGSPEVTIESEGFGITSEYIAVYNGILSITTSKEAVSCSELICSDEMTIQLPANGSFSATDKTILDSEGNAAAVVLITESVCQYADEYSYTTTHHWQPCLDPNCDLHSDPSLFKNYGKHDAAGENGACSICGYAEQTGEYEVYVGGFGLNSGDYLANTGAITTTEPDGGYAYYKNGVLTLNNYCYTGEGYYVSEDDWYTLIYRDGDLTVELVGETTLIGTDLWGSGISVENGLLTIAGAGAVTIDAAFPIDSYEDLIINGGTFNLSAKRIGDTVGWVNGIYATNNLTVNGGIFNINVTCEYVVNDYEDGFVAGLYADEGDLTINGGIIQITTNANNWGAGIYSYYGDIIINGGEISIVDAGYDYGICAYYGGVVINDGKVTAAVNSDGINADSAVNIHGGIVEITSNYDGIYCYYDVTITGGTVDVYARWYGIYADGYLTISGSNTVIEAESYNGYGAIYSEYGMEIDSPLFIQTPEGGYVDEYCIVDEDGEIATKVLIARDIAPDVEEYSSVFVGDVELVNGDYLAIDSKFTSETKPEVGYAYYMDGVLTLNNYSYSGSGYKIETDWHSTIYSTTDLTVNLVGENKLVNTELSGDGISVDEGANLTITGQGSLNINAAYGLYGEGTYNSNDTYVNGGNIVIESGDITISYSKTVSADYSAIGIYSDGSISIKGGNVGIDVSLTAANDSVYTYAWGIYSEDKAVSILGGKVDITSSDYGIEADSDDVEITNSTITIATTEGDGIYADNAVNISNSNVTITAGADGIYADDYEISIENSVVEVTAAEDGIQTEDDEVVITKSTVKVDADNYGIYSEADYDVTISDSSVTIVSANTGVFIDGGNMTIDNSKVDIRSDKAYAIVCEHLTVEGKQLFAQAGEDAHAISCSSMTVDSGLVIQTPANGAVDTDSEGNSTVVDAEGNAAVTVFISTSHAFGTEYAHNDTHHWLICNDTDCPLPSDGSLHQYVTGSGYAEHSYSDATCENPPTCSCGATTGSAHGHLDRNTDHICDYGCSVTIGNCVDTNKDHKCDYGCDKYFAEHNYGDPQFSWQLDYTSATITSTCPSCEEGTSGKSVSAECKITSQWDASTNTLTFTATAEILGQSYTDVQYIKFAMEEGKLTAEFSLLKENATAPMILVVAAYSDNGKMTGCQIVNEVIHTTEIDLNISGDSFRIFFLQPETYSPVMAAVTLG